MSKEWDKYWLECLSTHNEALYIDLLNRHNIPFVRKAMIMCDGTVLGDDDYAAWYFTYPELIESTRKLIWDFGWQRFVTYPPLILETDRVRDFPLTLANSYSWF